MSQYNYPNFYIFNYLSKKRKKRIPTDEKAPKMLPIKEVAIRTGISENHIRKLCKAGKISFIKVGSKHLINYNLFIDYLNGKN